jgi:RNA polymerase sigma-70 factor (ECF subfamily)
MDALAGRPAAALAWDWRRARQVCLGETRRVLGAGPASEDAAQEAVLRAWRHRDRCGDPDRPGPWLRRIARNEAMRIAARPRDSPLDTVPDPEWHAPGSDPAEEAAAELAHRMLTGLPTPDRRLVFLQVWEDTPISEIAALLQLPEGTVKIRLHRARAAMRRMIEQEP